MILSTMNINQSSWHYGKYFFTQSTSFLTKIRSDFGATGQRLKSKKRVIPEKFRNTF